MRIVYHRMMHSDWFAYLCLCRHIIRCWNAPLHFNMFFLFLSSFSTRFLQYHTNISRCRRQNFLLYNSTGTQRIDTTKKEKKPNFMSYLVLFFFLHAFVYLTIIQMLHMDFGETENFFFIECGRWVSQHHLILLFRRMALIMPLRILCLNFVQNEE